MKKLYLLFLILVIFTISFIVLEYFTLFSFFDSISEIDKTITFGLLIANGIVAALIYYQLHQSKNHFLDLNRPWVHLDLGYVNVTSYFFDKPRSSTQYPLFLVNRGKLSALDIEIVFLKSESNIMESVSEYIPKNIQFNSIPPNFKYRLFDDLISIISDSQYLVYSISYKFNGETYNDKLFLTNFDGSVPTCTDKIPDRLCNL